MVWCSMVSQGRQPPNATITIIGDLLGITDVDHLWGAACHTDRDQPRSDTLQQLANKEPSKELTWVMSNGEPTRSIQSFQLMDYRCFATIVQPNHQDVPGYRSQACHARDRVAPSQSCLTQLRLNCHNRQPRGYGEEMQAVAASPGHNINATLAASCVFCVLTPAHFGLKVQ